MREPIRRNEQLLQADLPRTNSITPQPERLAYRISMNAKSLAQIRYLHYSLGILTWVAFDGNIPICEYATQSKKAVGDADKLSACDTLLGIPSGTWTNEKRLAALSAWMSLDA